MATLLQILLYLPWKLWTCLPKSLRRFAYLAISRRWGVSTHTGGAYRLPFNLALKHTRDLPPRIEANNLRFIRHNTSIPVPTVLDLIPPAGNSSGLLLSTWVDGETLSQWFDAHVRWPPGFQKNLDIVESESSTSAERAASLAALDSMQPYFDIPDDHPLLSDLRVFIHEMRSLPPPSSGFICGVDGGPLVWARCFDRQMLQPVESVAAFHDLLFQQVSWKSRLARIHLIAAPVLEKHHRICFTHSDLNPDNIIVKDNRLAALIDWEFAGWYPEYWEFTQLEMQNLHLRVPVAFWNRVGLFKGQYDDELRLERALWHSTGDMAIAPGVISDDPLDQPCEP